ncbi:MAG: flavohemoglobin expression-modulating QEGLA motif protein [Bacteroidales bacterium]|nr:flavohemoglobin expression-modulating QEGLA motif protein [Bacteroidales bacterium]MCF8456486.1 flavohemoglobin expression-modulating QEGLA motif protein [Bacteroidales bacterium]
MVKKQISPITDSFIDTICERLAENKQVRRTLPLWGRLHIDRQLPFLCIYRQRVTNDDSLSERLIIGEASYLIATGNRNQQKQISVLVKRIAQTLKKSFGSFLILEVWLTQDDGQYSEMPTYKPAFTIFKPKKTAINSTIETLAGALREVKIRREAAKVEIVEATKISPSGLSPVLSMAEAKELGCHIIGIEVRPIYRDAETKQIFPLLRRDLQRRFAKALKNCFFEFTLVHTPYRPLHYQSLGRRSMVKAVWEIDRQLANICNEFDFLLQVTPTNSKAAWAAFQRNKFEVAPQFTYRPLVVDPALSKRRLFQVPIEKIEDPTLAQLFRGQQLELDRKFTMLIDRGTRSFMYGSLQLFGGIEDSLMDMSLELLQQLSPRSREEATGFSVDAKAFAARANQEIAWFKKTVPEIRNKVVVRDDISGLMVSHGNVLIGSHLKIPTARIEALIQHEVGTHVLTHINGKAQPLRQLYVGLAGYEELQEGLAVLSEYMVDGLTQPRMRLLAARVVAARNMINGATFIDVFRELNNVHGFERYTAFYIAMRTFRSGGLTKDAVYLRGLVQLLEYIKKGGELEPLFVGKISADHIPIVKELQWRKVLHPAPLRPSYFDTPQTVEKLKDLRNGLTLINLIKRKT